MVGKGVPRVDGWEKCTGEAGYTIDLKLPRMLYGKILRSPLPHARIVSIDTRKARRLPGVKAVITGENVPAGRYGTWLKDQIIFSRNKVRYIGEPVAALAAVDEFTAQDALELIQVEYEELPAVFDPIEAMEPGAPIIHEDLASYESIPGFPTIKHGNVCSFARIKFGDVYKGFQAADYVFEHTFKTQRHHQSYIEPHAAVAQVDSGGNITVWSSTQTVFQTQAHLADALKIPHNKIRVIAPYVGGAFGGKLELMVEPYCLLLAAEAKRPVKIVMTREEEFIAGNPRHPVIAEIKTGVKKDGQLTARQGKLIFDSGAYAHEGPGVNSYAAFCVKGPYNIPDLLAEASCVYTNNIVCGGFRGFGAPQTYFATESQLDIIARELSMDPLELRLKNAQEKGDRVVTGHAIPSSGFKETLLKVAEKLDWGQPKSVANRGKGIACMLHPSGLLSSGAIVKMEEDGTVNVLVGSSEIGGGQKTIFSQIAAEELGIPLDAVTVTTSDTATTPFDWSTAASRSTFTVGNAVKMAAADAKRQIIEKAATLLEANVADLEAMDGRVYVKGTPERSVPMGQLMLMRHYLSGGPVIGKGAFCHTEPFEPGVLLEGISQPPYASFIFGTQGTEVEVDPRTGKVKILRFAAAHDCGRAINPLAVEGQIEGGVVIGLGYGLTENVVLDSHGNVVNPSFLDYKIASIRDLPKITPIIVESQDALGPFGAKGVGEPGLVPTAPAIANAIYDAVGVRITDLPVSAEKVLTAMKDKGA